MSVSPAELSITRNESSLWFRISSAQLMRFVRSLMRGYQVIGPQRRQRGVVLDRLKDAVDLELEFPAAVHSPKKFLFPHWDELFRFRLDGNVLLEAETTSPPRVLFGLHACDLNAISILDDCLFEGESDSAYKAKRETTLLFGVDCTPDDHCFCSSLGTDRVKTGFDLFFHAHDGEYLIEIGSQAGRQALADHAAEVLHREGEIPRQQPTRQCEQRLEFPSEALPLLLKDAYEDPLWQQLGDRCLGCGSCTLLCPTCYCFNVQDKLELSLKEGQRLRTWDSCQFDQFAKVNSGDNFRSSQADRQRHRFYRKYKYLWQRHQRTACVGCGRCSRECLARISPTESLNQLYHQSNASSQAAIPGQEYQPQMAQISEIRELSVNDRLLRLKLPQPLRVRAGRFIQLSVFGLGEAPFSFASGQGQEDEIDLVVRQAGALTAALHRMRPGDRLGVRGPFGNGFPLEQMRGQDLLLIAGGRGLIVLRALIHSLLAERSAYGRITLLVGARSISSLLFRQDLFDWHRSGLLDCRFGVNEAMNSWGVPNVDVSYLLRDLEINSNRTIAALSGPPEMYRTVNPLLFRLGIEEENLFLNLERHMKCGLGKCGKCRINDICVCECGPIFSYSQVKHLAEAIER